MNIRKTNTLTRILMSLIVVFAGVHASAVLAQEPGERYRPDGRNIASQISRQFDVRLYEVRTLDPMPEVAEFAAASIFYPLTLSFDAPMGGVVLIPGYQGTQSNYDWWGPMLASFGYAVMIIDTNTPTDNLAARKAALIAAVDYLKAQNSRDDSALQGKLDVNKIGIMGHSLGGGGALAAADELGDNINALIPLLPYCCELGQSFDGDYSGLDVPTMIIASAEDTIAAPAQHARALYDSIADATPKAYVEFATGDHMLATNGGPDLTTLGRYALAWLKLHMDGEESFAAVFAGNMDDEFAGKFSRFESE